MPTQVIQMRAVDATGKVVTNRASVRGELIGVAEDAW